jgi:hypothetical protein
LTAIKNDVGTLKDSNLINRVSALEANTSWGSLE